MTFILIILGTLAALLVVDIIFAVRIVRTVNKPPFVRGRDLIELSTLVRSDNSQAAMSGNPLPRIGDVYICTRVSATPAGLRGVFKVQSNLDRTDARNADGPTKQEMFWFYHTLANYLYEARRSKNDMMQTAEEANAWQKARRWHDELEKEHLECKYCNKLSPGEPDQGVNQ